MGGGGPENRRCGPDQDVAETGKRMSFALSKVHKWGNGLERGEMKKKNVVRRGEEYLLR